MKIEIDAKTVKNLRTARGAGMMNCKKALVENDGVAQFTRYVLGETKID